MKNLIINEKLSLIVSFCKNLTQREFRGSLVGLSWVVRESMNRRWSVDGALMEDRWSHDSAKNANMQMCKIANLHFCKSGKAHLARLAATLLMIVTLGVGEVWGADSAEEISATSNSKVYTVNIFSSAAFTCTYPTSKQTSGGVMKFKSDTQFNGVNPSFVATMGKFTNKNNNAGNTLSQVGNSSDDVLGDYAYIAGGNGVTLSTKGYRGLLCCNLFNDVKTITVNANQSGNEKDQHFLMVAEKDGGKDVSQLTFTQVASCTGKTISLSKTFDTAKDVYVAIVAYRSGSGIKWNSTQGVYGFSVTMETSAPSCSWNINYITNGKKDSEDGKVWSENNCFTQVGSTNEWRLENFVMPSLRGQFWVGPGSFKDTDGGHSVIADLTTIKICQHDLGLPTNTYSPMEGGVGTLVIWSNSGDENYAVRFLPTYQITYDNDGDGNWESYPFAWVSDHEYKTDILQIPSGYDTKNFYVGCKKEDGATSYVMWENGGGNDEKSKTIRMSTMGGLTSGEMAGKYGKFTIYDNSSDPNWFCSFAEYYVVELYNQDVLVGERQSSLASNPGNVVFKDVEERAGYTFGGWARVGGESYTAVKTAGTWPTNYTMSKSYERFNAVWTANQYTITLNNQSATTAGTASVTATYDANTNLTSAITKPAKTDYTFGGYYTAQNGEGSQVIDADGNFKASVSGYTDASKNWIKAEAVTLYAKWTEDAPSGECDEIASYTLNNPTTGSAQSDGIASYKVQSDNFTFDNHKGYKLGGQGQYFGIIGTFSVGDKITVYLTKVPDAGNNDGNLTLFSDKSGNTQIGTISKANLKAGENEFTLTSAVSGVYVVRTSTCTQNPYIYSISVCRPTACDKTKATLEWTTAPKDGTVGDADVTLAVNRGSSTGDVTYTSSNTSVATIVDGNKLHYVAAGTATITANLAGDATYCPKSIEQAITVTAAPAPTQYTITVNDAGAGQHDCSKNASAAAGENVSIENTCEVTGYHLTGYTSSPEVSGTLVGTTYTFTMPASNVTLTAVWEADAKYTVTFVANGATGSVPTETAKTAGTKFTLPSATGLTYADHVFVGWKSSANDVTYNAGVQYTMTAANTTFTAQWREVSQWHTITPNIGGTNYESYPFSETHDGNSVASTFTNWVSGALYGTSSSSWSAPARFRSSGKNGKIRGNEIIFKVTNCKSVAVWGKSGSNTRAFKVTVYNEDKTQVVGTHENRTNSAAQVLVEGLTPASNYVVVVSSTDKNNNSEIYSISFEAPGAAPCETPNITAQQTASATYCAGDFVTALSVTASVSDGGSLSYQWYKGEDPIDDATAYRFTPSESGSYKCIVTNTKSGSTNAQAASEVAVITINATTAITNQPTASQTVPAGSPVSLTVAATGTDLSYQWKSCATADGEYTPIMTVAAGKATYTFTPNAVGDTYYKCAVTGACGTETSNAALVTVTTAAPTVTWNTETSAYKGQLLTVSVTTNSDAALATGNLTTSAGTLRDVTIAGKTFTGYLEVPADATGTITLTLHTAAGATFGALESDHEIAISGSCPDSGTETLYSFQITSLDQNNTTEQPAIGGTATFGKALLNESSVASNRIAAKLDGNPAADNTKYVLVKLKKALKNGDVVTVKGYTANTPNESYSFVISDSRTATKRYKTLTNTAKNKEEELQFTVSSVETGLGATQFYISRNTGSVFLTGVTVTSTGSATTLTWDDAEVSSGSTVEKTIGDAEFTIPAISNSIGTISYTSGTTGTATVNASGTVRIVNTGTTVITATVADAGCYAGKSITYTLRVNAACEAPVITKDLSTDIVEYEQRASATALSISATGSNLHYQWYKNTTDDTETGTIINGATSASYTPGMEELGTTYYYCVVSSGACSTTSAVAKIVVMADACFTYNTEHALGSNDATYVIDLGAGSSFEAGTVIYGRVKVGTVKGGDGVKVQNTIINICAGTNIAAKDTWYDFAYVVPANSQLIGQQSITLVRASGTNTRIKDVKVTGCGTPCALPQPLIVAGTPVVDHETCQETVRLTAKTPDGTANYNIGGGTMQWYKDGEAIPSATAVTYMVTEEGTYYVMFTNGCSVMSSNSYIEKDLEPGVQRLAPLQYYHVGKTYTEQMKDRHLFVVNSFGLHDGNTYLLEATLNDEEYNVTTIRSAIYTIADDDVANTDTVMIDLNALNGKGFNVGDELVLSVSPVNLCGNYVDDLKQSITIYMIDETPTLAFIVSGADGEGTKIKSKLKLNGDFLTGYNKADLKTQTSATAVSEAELPLYTALRSEFNVTPVNGYAVFNIFNYEPYDLLFLTDFVKSDGSTDKAAAKKHVEALGNLVDYRPMFSTKGHMSGFNNWKEKGFTANPTVPKQTQVLMNIVCYAHPMFEGLTPDGANIYFDAIDDNETVFRMLSQGGYDSNKGIQGFEMNGANEFIKIALTHYDAHGTPDGNIMTPTAEADDRTLIASCERQANIEARFIILSLNADATSFLTEAGIDVIIRSLSYLLETNPIKVTDCHFDFDNAHGTGVWSDPGNWAPRHNVLPTKNVDVRISANCIVDTTSAVAASVRVKDGFTLTIADTAALTIQGIAQHQNAEGKLSPTSPSDLVVSGSSTGTGAFIHGDEAGKTGATVQMYSKANATADVDGSGATVQSWQWMTTPYNDVADAQYNYYGAWMYRYDNNNHQWSPQVVNGNGMTPFAGYCITQEGPKVYTMTGTLASTADQNISLVSGLNMVGNSWTAPINIAAFQDADFVNVQKTITILNTGLDANGSGASTQGVNNTPGQYVVIPIHSAAKMHNTLKVIPSMQAFELKATGTGAKLTLDYDRLVRTSSVNIQPMRAPGRSMAERTDEDYVNGIRLGDINTLRVSVTGNRYSAEVYLLENENFSNDYEDGWDGEWTRGDKAAVQLFARVNGVKYAVSALSTLVGAQLGTYKGEDTEYTIHFDYTGEQQLWWYDTKTGVYTEITNENTYTFTNTTTAVQYRFLITAVNPNMPTVPTGWDGIDDDSGPRKFIMDNHVYIMVNGALYDATGRLVY